MEIQSKPAGLSQTDYLEAIKDMPDPLSGSFIPWMLRRSRLVKTSICFTIVENMKYGPTHLTCFLNRGVRDLSELTPTEMKDMAIICSAYSNKLMYINPSRAKSVSRFHFHLCQTFPPKYWAGSHPTN